MASVAERKYSATVALVEELATQMIWAYEDKRGCAGLKNQLIKIERDAKVVLGKSNRNFAKTVWKLGKPRSKDLDAIDAAMDRIIEAGDMRASSYRTLVVYVIGLVNDRWWELHRHNGDRVKMEMIKGLEENLLPVYEHFACRNKRWDLDEAGLKLQENFDGCW